MRLTRATPRAQGMTEYIIIIGLVAILLIVIVKSYSGLIDVTIQGGETQLQTMSNDIGNAGTDSPNDGGGNTNRPNDVGGGTNRPDPGN